MQRQLAAWYLCYKHRALWNLALTLALMFFIGILLFKKSTENPQTNLVASRKAMLALAPEVVPQSENAAEDYKLAEKAKVAYNGPTDNAYYLICGKEDSKLFEHPAIQAFLSANATSIKYIYAGSKKAHCNFGYDYNDIRFTLGVPNLSQMRDWARVLATQARVSAHAGDHQEAAKAIAAGYAIARHMESDPLIICSLVSVAMSALTNGAVESIMNWETPTKLEDITAYREAIWRNQQPFERMVRDFYGEKAYVFYNVDLIACGQTKEESTFKALAFCYSSERCCLNALLDEIITKCKHKKILDTNDLLHTIEEHQTGPVPMTNEVLPVYKRAQTSLLRCEDQSRVIDAGLAFLQFRAKYKHDPKSLDELVPEFLPEVPKDSFHGQPIRMRVDPNGIVKSDGNNKFLRRNRGLIRIYTLDEKGVDDGGYGYGYECKPKPHDDHNEYESVFRVLPADPKARALIEETRP